MEWQEISTAPKDGTLVLLYGPYRWMGFDDGPEEDSPVGCVVGSSNGTGWSTVTDNPYFDDVYPTHWMPLPSAPA